MRDSCNMSTIGAAANAYARFVDWFHAVQAVFIHECTVRCTFTYMSVGNWSCQRYFLRSTAFAVDQPE